jgi:hypothetical protein
MGVFTAGVEDRIHSVRDEVCDFCVGRCEKLLESNELLKHSDHLLLLHPEWRIPMILSENGKLNLCDQSRVTKRLLPTVECSSIIRSVRALSPNLQFSDILEAVCRAFPILSGHSLLNCLNLAQLNLSASEVVGARWPEYSGLTVRQCPASASDPLKGMIAHLTGVCGGNVHDRDAIIVTASKGDSSPKVVADLTSNDRFCSEYRPKEGDIPHTRNNWICYDFKDRRVIPTHYAIRSASHGAGPGWGNYLKSWLIEISSDGEAWVEIDRKENNSELAAEHAIRTFEVSRIQICRLIRLVNLGRNHQGYDCLCMCGFEILGSLLEFPG